MEEEIEPVKSNDDTKPILKADHGKVTLYLISCLTIPSIGAGFQYGWNLSLLNNPAEVIKEFIREVYKKDTGVDMNNSTVNTYWAITNGLLPFGVNLVMILSSILGIVSKYLQSYYVLMVSRFLSGLYLGVSNTILPIYLTECSSNNIRGWSGSLIQVAVAMGILAGHVLGMPQLLGTRDLWPVLFGLSLVPAFVQCFLVFYSETPKYIYTFLKDKKKAEKVLLKLRGGDIDEVNLELNELENETIVLKDVPPWKNFLTDQVLFRALVVAVMIQIAQQLTGKNVFVFYSNEIFNSAGFSIFSASLITIASSSTNLVFTVISMILVDKTGRKPLLLWSCVGMFFSTISLTLGRIYVNPSLHWIGYLAIFSLLAYQIFYGIGMGPIPKYINSELFVSSARAKGNTIAFFFNWLFTFLVVVCFPFINSALGNFSIFIFSACLFFIAVYVVVFVPETKSKPIDKIVAEFSENFVFYSTKKD